MSIRNFEWYNANSLRRFPLGEESNIVSNGISIPDNLFVDGIVYSPDEQVFIESLQIDEDGNFIVSLTGGLTCSVNVASYTPFTRVNILFQNKRRGFFVFGEGISDALSFFSDRVYSFTNCFIESGSVFVLPEIVNSISKQGSNPLTGIVNIIAGEGFRITKTGNNFQFSAIFERETCEEERTNCIKCVNGIFPDDLGNLIISPKDTLFFAPDTNGLILNSVISQQFLCVTRFEDNLRPPQGPPGPPGPEGNRGPCVLTFFNTGPGDGGDGPGEPPAGITGEPGCEFIELDLGSFTENIQIDAGVLVRDHGYMSFLDGLIFKYYDQNELEAFALFSLDTQDGITDANDYVYKFSGFTIIRNGEEEPFSFFAGRHRENVEFDTIEIDFEELPDPHFSFFTPSARSEDPFSYYCTEDGMNCTFWSTWEISEEERIKKRVFLHIKTTDERFEIFMKNPDDEEELDACQCQLFNITTQEKSNIFDVEVYPYEGAFDEEFGIPARKSVFIGSEDNPERRFVRSMETFALMGCGVFSTNSWYDNENLDAKHKSVSPIAGIFRDVSIDGGVVKVYNNLFADLWSKDLVNEGGLPNYDLPPYDKNEVLIESPVTLAIPPFEPFDTTLIRANKTFYSPQESVFATITENLTSEISITRTHRFSPAGDDPDFGFDHNLFKTVSYDFFVSTFFGERAASIAFPHFYRINIEGEQASELPTSQTYKLKCWDPINTRLIDAELLTEYQKDIQIETFGGGFNSLILPLPHTGEAQAFDSFWSNGFDYHYPYTSPTDRLGAVNKQDIPGEKTEIFVINQVIQEDPDNDPPFLASSGLLPEYFSSDSQVGAALDRKFFIPGWPFSPRVVFYNFTLDPHFKWAIYTRDLDVTEGVTEFRNAEIDDVTITLTDTSINPNDNIVNYEFLGGTVSEAGKVIVEPDVQSFFDNLWFDKTRIETEFPAYTSTIIDYCRNYAEQYSPILIDFDDDASGNTETMLANPIDFPLTDFEDFLGNSDGYILNFGNEDWSEIFPDSALMTEGIKLESLEIAGSNERFALNRNTFGVLVDDSSQNDPIEYLRDDRFRLFKGGILVWSGFVNDVSDIENTLVVFRHRPLPEENIAEYVTSMLGTSISRGYVFTDETKEFIDEEATFLPTGDLGSGTTGQVLVVGTDKINDQGSWALEIYDNFSSVTYNYTNINGIITTDQFSYRDTVNANDPFHFLLNLELARTGDTKPDDLDLYIPPFGFLKLIEVGTEKIGSDRIFAPSFDGGFINSINEAPGSDLDGADNYKKFAYAPWLLKPTSRAISDDGTRFLITFESKDFGINDDAEDYVVGALDSIKLSTEANILDSFKSTEWDENETWIFGLNDSNVAFVPYWTFICTDVTYVPGKESEGGEISVSRDIDDWLIFDGSTLRAPTVNEAGRYSFVLDRVGDKVEDVSARLDVGNIDFSFDFTWRMEPTSVGEFTINLGQPNEEERKFVAFSDIGFGLKSGATYIAGNFDSLKPVTDADGPGSFKAPGFSEADGLVFGFDEFGVALVPYWSSICTSVSYISGFEATGGRLNVSKRASNWLIHNGVGLVNPSVGTNVTINRVGDKFNGVGRIDIGGQISDTFATIANP